MRAGPSATADAAPPGDTQHRSQIDAGSGAASSGRTQGRSFAGAELIAALLVCVALAGLSVDRRAPGIASRPPMSLIILPFQNLSGNAADDYLADGITDDITSDMSRIPGMFVVARTTALSLKGKPMDPRHIGEDLGVRYLLEGSVRKIEETVRVNAHLIDAETGQDIRADRFDQPLRDLNTGQDAIVRRIGTALNIQIVDIEAARSQRERPTNPDAFDLVLRARSIWGHPMAPREEAEKIALYEQALRLDPGSVLAMAGLAYALIESNRRGDDLRRAAKLLADAAEISPDSEQVLGDTGYLDHVQGRSAKAVANFERVLEINPNSHLAYNAMGAALIRLGRSEDAIPAFEKANRLDPAGPYAFSRYNHLAFACLMLGRNEETILWERRALAAHPGLRPDWRANWTLHIAAAEARLSRLDAARQAVAEANSIWPYLTARGLADFDLSNTVFAQQFRRYVDAVRLAGERDHAEEDADFGVAPDDGLHDDLAGLTPMTAPGAATIRTAELQRLLTQDQPLLIDSLANSWGRSIQGAVGLKDAGSGGNYTDGIQDRLRQKVRDLTGGDATRPIVAVGWNSERFDGRNLALRLAALGYTRVYWYRGGREAWEVQGLPENDITPQAW